MDNRETNYLFVIDKNLCKNCGICVVTCPQKIYSFDQRNELKLSGIEKCKHCNLCFYKCPDFAIKLEVS